MSFYPRDDWTLRYEQSNEGELYREKERLQQELEDTQARQRREDYEREQAEYRTRERLEQERETRIENIANAMGAIREKDAEVEHLKLCMKFGVEEEEGEP